MSGYESDTCGRSYTIRIRYVWTQIFLYPHKKICGYKNLRIRVDGALVTFCRCHSQLHHQLKEVRNQQDIEVMKRCHVIGMTVTGATMRANLLGIVYLIVHCSNLSNFLSAKKHLMLCVRLQSHFAAFRNQARGKLCWEN